MKLIRIMALVSIAMVFLSLSPIYACEIAEIMFGKISIDIVPHKGYETAIIRCADFESKKHSHGAIIGEITVDRGGFAVRNINQVVIGTISPDLKMEGWSDDCDENQKISIQKVQPGAYVIMNGKMPVGTIEGRFPKNDFGVK